jgi:hypothetical protein
MVNDYDLVNIPPRHKHADVIIAWANGAEVQFKSKETDCWTDVTDPQFYDQYKYRVKPECDC